MSRAIQANPFFARRARRVTALLALVWLNLAMLPCAMAMGQVDTRSGCPTEHASHGSIAMDAGMSSQHGHAVADNGSGSETTDCCDLGQFNVGERNQKSGKHDLEQPVLVAAIESAFRSEDVRASYTSSGPPTPHRGSRRLHVLFCVYLD